MEETNCIFCNNASSVVVIEEGGYTGRKCAQCNLIYISPRPTLAALSSMYRDNKANCNLEAHIRSGRCKRSAAKRDLKILKRYLPSGDLLEIGMGAGYFLDEARKSGFDVYGIDLNSAHVNYARSKFNLNCKTSPIDTRLFNSKKFDIIYFSNVIAHLYDPISDFKKINKILKNDGLIMFETANIADINDIYFKVISSFHYPDHLYYFGEQSIKTLLELTGFRFITMHRYPLLPAMVFSNALSKMISRTPFKHKIKTSMGANSISGTTADRTKKRIDATQFMYSCYSYVGRVCS